MSVIKRIIDVCLHRERTAGRETLKKAYQSVFSTPAGRLVLEDICTSLRLVQNPKSDHAGMADERAFRAGEQSVALRILRMLED